MQSLHKSKEISDFDVYINIGGAGNKAIAFRLM